MDRRNRERLAMSAFCRVAPASNPKRTSWKRIENISGAGMLVVWSSDSDTPPPRIGESYTVELQLPPHPVFGQRAMQFQTKVVRAFRVGNGKLMAGLETTHGRFRSIRPGTWPEACEGGMVN